MRRTEVLQGISIHAYEAAQEQFPGYSIEYLENRWMEWLFRYQTAPVNSEECTPLVG